MKNIYFYKNFPAQQLNVTCRQIQVRFDNEIILFIIDFF